MSGRTFGKKSRFGLILLSKDFDAVWESMYKTDFHDVGDIFYLDLENPNVIGRNPETTTILASGSARRHCKIDRRADSGDFLLTDIAGVNPTIINDVMLKPQGSAVINHGDVIQCGCYIYRFEELSDTETDQPSSES